MMTLVACDIMAQTITAIMFMYLNYLGEVSVYIYYWIVLLLFSAVSHLIQYWVSAVAAVVVSYSFW